MFGWFKSKEASAFGETLADYYMKHLPVQGGKKGQYSAKKQEQVLDNLFAQAAEFKTRHKLNLFSKAALGNAFRWKLVQHQYESNQADALTKLLMHRL
ncbi:hypothetical protein [Noviherbaspirillum galbum]|uniref:Uncharacterized protein n=1 Tax=Noviherbaspirillum galbum TaxID=2709383 RepID=A0A6B3SHA2_9BURK|nr:hypothetical protein [Noviherbaspirillum galbum]NEX60023.1 hypothetical protein [Noviherbaspirillum galbum]